MVALSRCFIVIFKEMTGPIMQTGETRESRRRQQTESVQMESQRESGR